MRTQLHMNSWQDAPGCEDQLVAELVPGLSPTESRHAVLSSVIEPDAAQACARLRRAQVHAALPMWQRVAWRQVLPGHGLPGLPDVPQVPLLRVQLRSAPLPGASIASVPVPERHRACCCMYPSGQEGASLQLLLGCLGSMRLQHACKALRSGLSQKRLLAMTFTACSCGPLDMLPASLAA